MGDRNSRCKGLMLQKSGVDNRNCIFGKLEARRQNRSGLDLKLFETVSISRVCPVYGSDQCGSGAGVAWLVKRA